MQRIESDYFWAEGLLECNIPVNKVNATCDKGLDGKPDNYRETEKV